MRAAENDWREAILQETLKRRLQNCDLRITRDISSQRVGLADKPDKSAVLDRSSGFEIIFTQFLIIDYPRRYQVSFRFIGIEDRACSQSPRRCRWT